MLPETHLSRNSIHPKSCTLSHHDDGYIYIMHGEDCDLIKIRSQPSEYRTYQGNMACLYNCDRWYDNNYYENMKYFKYSLSIIIILISLSLGIAILGWDPQWLSKINGSTQNVWWEGCWHALCLPAHFIRNIFVETNCISHNGSVMYYVVYCLTIIAEPFLNIIIGSTLDEKEV